MTIEDQIRYEKLQYDINREAAKISALSSVNIFQVKKYCHLINSKSQNQLNLLILLRKKFLKDKHKQLKVKEKSKLML